MRILRCVGEKENAGPEESCAIGIRSKAVDPERPVQEPGFFQAKNPEYVETIRTEAKAIFGFQFIDSGKSFFHAIVDANVEKVDVFGLTRKEAMNDLIVNLHFAFSFAVLMEAMSITRIPVQAESKVL